MNDEDIVKEFLDEIAEQIHDYHYFYNYDVTNCIIPLDTLLIESDFLVYVFYCADNYIHCNIRDLASNNVFYNIFVYDKSLSIEKNVKLFFEFHIMVLKYEQ